MKDHLPQDTALQDLAGELAELETQLRLLVTDPAAEEGTWPVLASLAVRKDLLAGLAAEAGHPALSTLTDGVGAVLEVGRQRPGALPPPLETFLQEMDAACSRVLTSLDEGQDLDAALARPDWQWLRLRLRYLDTPLEIFATLHSSLSRWQERWCDEDLAPETETELARRWALLRDLGDALFLSGDSVGQGSSLLRWQGFGDES